MIAAAVRYHRATSLDDAFEALADPEARALAGGQSLLPLMKLRIARPSVVVDIARLGLRGAELEGETLRIGALTTWDDLGSERALERPALAGLAECAATIGDLQVRNRGTLGGSLVHADPSSDVPAVLLALGATVELRSAVGTRSIPLSKLFLGPYLTALEPGELLTEVRIPHPAPGSGSAYESFEHPASGFALAGAAAAVGPDGARAVALTGISDRAVPLAAGDLEAAVEAVDVLGDDFASADYRRHLALVVARLALERAGARAEEDVTWNP